MDEKLESGTTSVASFVARTRILLPVAGPNGDRLAVILQPISWENILEVTQRLPGAVPGSMLARKQEAQERKHLLSRLQAEDTTPEQMKELLAEVEVLVEEAREGWKELAPTIEKIVRLGVCEPMFTFTGEPDRADAVPWRLVDVRNQLAIFHALMERHGYEGGAVEQTETFRAGEQGGSSGSGGSLRPREDLGQAAVRGVDLQGNPGGPAEDPSA